MMWVEKCDNKTVGGMRVRRRDTRIWFVMMAVFFAVQNAIPIVVKLKDPLIST